MHNVADDPAYANVVKDLREKLLAELKRTGDPRVENDGVFFENPPLAGPLNEEPPRPRRRNR
jgi:hypothetical protein